METLTENVRKLINNHNGLQRNDVSEVSEVSEELVKQYKNGYLDLNLVFK